MSSTSTQRPKKPSILHIFPSALTARQYLSRLTQHHFSASEQARGIEAIDRFLDQAYVLPEDDSLPVIPQPLRTADPIINHDSAQTRARLQDAINQVVANTLRAYNSDNSRIQFRDLNCLALGYRLKSSNCEVELRSCMDIEFYHANTIHALIHATPWPWIADELGEKLFMHILSRPVFIPADNNSYIQVSGTPAQSLLQKPQSCTASVDSVSGYGRVEIPRYSALYCNGHSQRLWRDFKTSMLSVYQGDIQNATRVAEEMFGVYALHLDPEESALVMEECLPVVQDIAKEFCRLSVPALLQFHCAGSSNSLVDSKPSSRIVPATQSSDLKMWQSASTQSRGMEVLNKKKTRRGSRAGKLVKKRKFSSTVDRGAIQQPMRIGGDRPREETETIGQFLANEMLSSLHRSAAMPSYLITQEDPKSQFKPQDVAPLSEPRSSQLSGNLSTRPTPTSSVLATASTALSSLPAPSGDTVLTKAWDAAPDVAPHRARIASHHFSRSAKCRAKSSDKKAKASLPCDVFAMATAPAKVSAFIKSVCRRLFTISGVWGSRRNLNKFLRAIDNYMLLGKGEAVTLSQLSKGIRVKSLVFVDRGYKARNLSPKVDWELLLRSGRANYFLARLLNFIVSNVVNPLLASFFYVTEGEGMAAALLYYRKHVWDGLVAAGCDQLQGHFLPVHVLGNSVTKGSSAKPCTDIPRGPSISEWWAFSDDYQSAQNPSTAIPRTTSTSSCSSSSSKPSASLHIPTVRFVPKPSSLRAITNMRSRGAQRQSSNSNLYTCLNILREIRDKHPYLSGFGVQGMDEIFFKLRKYKQEITRSVDGTENLPCNQLNKPLNSNATEPNSPFFIAVLDLEKCYDHVDTKQLFEVITGVVNSNRLADESHANEFIVHKYSASYYLSSMERTVTRHIRHTTQGEGALTFKDASKLIASQYRSSLIVDGVLYPRMSQADVLGTLKTHLFSHFVRLPVVGRDSSNNTYTQVRGIPQGSVLSPILCDLYYGSAEREVFGSDRQVQLLGLDDGRTLILRLMDDYIVISTQKECVEHFLQQAHSCLRPYGGGVNPAKTRTTFDVSIELNGKRTPLQTIAKGSHVPWCGYLIDPCKLELTPSYERLLARPLQYSFAIPPRNVGISLRKLVKSFVRVKCHALVLDKVLNSKLSIAKTVHRLFFLAALRTMSAIRKLCSGIALVSKVGHLFRCVDSAVKFGSRLVQARARRHRPRRLMFQTCKHREAQPLTAFQSAVAGVHFEDFVVDEEECALTVDEVLWLGYDAFIKAFKIDGCFLSKLTGLITYRHYKIQKKMHEKNNDEFAAIMAITSSGNNELSTLFRAHY